MADVKEEILKLRESRTPCSQATLLGLKRGLDADLPDENILRSLASGLRGGIGATRDEGTCGALTGAVVALGLLFKDNEMKSLRLSRETFESFKNHFGTVICGRLVAKDGTAHCAECCTLAGCKVAELYKREKQ